LQAIIQGIGAAAGLADVVGFALLSVLHLSQAREVKRLREWAGRAPERAGPGVTVVPRRSKPWYSRIGGRHVAVAFVGLLVLGGAARYGVTRLSGGDSGNAQAVDKGSPNTPKRNGAAVEPGNVTVAVLNGTTVSGLAAALRDQVAAAGFDKGTIDDFPDQLAESVVQYAPGHEAEAKAVGGTLGISRREPVTADSRALAGDATVIVIAGADKAP
jgi:hypothetical protein